MCGQSESTTFEADAQLWRFRRKLLEHQTRDTPDVDLRDHARVCPLAVDKIQGRSADAKGGRHKIVSY
jgi:hypothetical protein